LETVIFQHHRYFLQTGHTQPSHYTERIKNTTVSYLINISKKTFRQVIFKILIIQDLILYEECFFLIQAPQLIRKN
jgi:hypothetical protein